MCVCVCECHKEVIVMMMMMMATVPSGREGCSWSPGSRRCTGLCRSPGWPCWSERTGRTSGQSEGQKHLTGQINYLFSSAKLHNDPFTQVCWSRETSRTCRTGVPQVCWSRETSRTCRTGVPQVCLFKHLFKPGVYSRFHYTPVLHVPPTFGK